MQYILQLLHHSIDVAFYAWDVISTHFCLRYFNYVKAMGPYCGQLTDCFSEVFILHSHCVQFHFQNERQRSYQSADAVLR